MYNQKGNLEGCTKFSGNCTSQFNLNKTFSVYVDDIIAILKYLSICHYLSKDIKETYKKATTKVSLFQMVVPSVIPSQASHSIYLQNIDKLSHMPLQVDVVSSL